jgi:hypothetical protein
MLGSEDWETLIIRFCNAHFVRRGAPKTRGHGWLGQLAADFARAKATSRLKDDTAICRLLVKGKSSRYRKFKVGTLRRQMPAARKELAKAIAEAKRQVELKLNGGLVARYPEDPHATRISLTPAQEKQLAGWVIEKYSTTDNPLPWKLPLHEIEAALRGN